MPNFSFKRPLLEDGGISGSSVNGNTTVVPGWSIGTSGGPVGPYDPQIVAFAGTDGDDTAVPGTANGGQIAFSNTTGANAFASLTSDVLGEAQANTLDTLTVASGDRLDIDPSDAVIELRRNGSVVASAMATAASLPHGTVTDFSTSFISFASGGDLQVRLRQQGVDTGVTQADFDNVRWDATPVVPEPVTYAMFGTGPISLAFFAVANRRKQRQAV